MAKDADFEWLEGDRGDCMENWFKFIALPIFLIFNVVDADANKPTLHCANSMDLFV